MKHKTNSRILETANALQIGGSVLRAMLEVCCLVCVVAVTFGQSPQPGARQYLVEFNSRQLPADLSARLAALGGAVIDTMPEAKVAIVGGMSESAAATLRTQTDVADVTIDEILPASLPQSFNPPRKVVSLGSLLATSIPEGALYYPYQWNFPAIGADRAWRAGYLGSPDVRIAIIDTGIDPTHPDLASLIDHSRSRSYCPWETPYIAAAFPGYPSWTDLQEHGTFVASVAASKGDLVAGTTSRSTLMAVKALCYNGTPLSNFLRGIAFAANNGADVINISAGVPFGVPKAGQRGFFHYFSLYVAYAFQKGVSAVVVAAGNDSADYDHDRNGFEFYCEVPGVICVSATGPTDSGPDLLGPFLNTDAPAFYSNFGSSAVSVAAPGGNATFDSEGNLLGYSLLWAACAGTDLIIFDDGTFMPGPCTRGGFAVAPVAGTSFAAPQVAGLAALLVNKYGHNRPAQVRSTIENSADDLGKPGVDPHYGRGRINVARALGIP